MHAKKNILYILGLVFAPLAGARRKARTRTKFSHRSPKEQNYKTNSGKSFEFRTLGFEGTPFGRAERRGVGRLGDEKKIFMR